MPQKTYPHDRLLARTVLPLIPKKVTPNQVTILRLLLTIPVAWLLVTENFKVGIPLFLFAAFTDALDGSMARIRDQVTEWGEVWDPIVDKFLIGSVGVILLLKYFPAELSILIFGIEAVVLTIVYFWKTKGRILPADIWGKLKMVFQVIGITMFLLSVSMSIPMLAWISYAVFILATIFAMASILKYVK